jgi:hypothetical protein
MAMAAILTNLLPIASTLLEFEMTYDQLEAWRKHMGWTQAQSCRELGISARTWQRKYATGGTIPRTVELACAALKAGIRLG